MVMEVKVRAGREHSADPPARGKKTRYYTTDEFFFFFFLSFTPWANFAVGSGWFGDAEEAHNKNVEREEKRRGEWPDGGRRRQAKWDARPGAGTRVGVVRWDRDGGLRGCGWY